jgi:hypothetical protein
MPTYKVLADSYINDRFVPASTDDATVFVDYDGNPGTNLEPTDEDGRARQTAYFAARGRTLQEAHRLRSVLIEDATDLRSLGAGHAVAPPPVASAVVHHVPIPRDWAKLDAARIIALAARLGAPQEVATRAAAATFIKAELDRRTGTAR